MSETTKHTPEKIADVLRENAELLETLLGVMTAIREIEPDDARIERARELLRRSTGRIGRHDTPPTAHGGQSAIDAREE